jgi:hypothetical protein
MPFIAAEIVTFFTDATNMGLTPCSATAFAAEEIATPADLAEFDKNRMELIFCNLRKPAKVLRGGALELVANSRRSWHMNSLPNCRFVC